MSGHVVCKASVNFLAVDFFGKIEPLHSAEKEDQIGIPWHQASLLFWMFSFVERVGEIS